MVQKHSATAPTPPTAPLKNASSDQRKMSEEQAAELRALFVTMAVQMSWQLAIVVIVPIVCGYLLDERLHTSPWITLAGFAAAMLGVIGVLRRVLSEANRRSNFGSPKGSV